MKLGELAGRIGAELRGDAERLVEGLGTLQNANGNQVSFLANARYRRHLQNTRAAAVILPPQLADECPVDVLVMDDSYVGYARAAQAFEPPEPGAPGVHASAWVDEDAVIHESAVIGAQCSVAAGAVIGAGVYLGPGCSVGRDSVIGDDCWLAGNVVLRHGVTLGRRVRVQPGAVIGSDGFGMARENGRWIRVPQLGGVRIGDDVDIGANTTIDRGALDDTVIEKGVKLDNQIQIAHNVHIGENTAVAACTGISGSTRIGRSCTIAGGVGIAGHLEIADNVHLSGMAMVTKSIPEAGAYASGTGLEPQARWRRNTVRYHQLDSLARRLIALEKKFGDPD